MIDDEDEIDNGTESSISKALESRRQCEQLMDGIPSSVPLLIQESRPQFRI